MSILKEVSSIYHSRYSLLIRRKWEKKVTIFQRMLFYYRQRLAFEALDGEDSRSFIITIALTYQVVRTMNLLTTRCCLILVWRRGLYSDCDGSII